jgi:thiosulfate/3-mercaptopyruvate sulfurtransferase
MRFVSTEWLSQHLVRGDVLVVDPRLRVRYTSAHIPTAVHVPVARAFDELGSLKDDVTLGEWLGGLGVGTDLDLVVYDDRDGQAGPLLGWILEYLGHPHVNFLEQPIEIWRAQGGEVRYRPVQAVPALFDVRVDGSRRATRENLIDRGGARIIDVRTLAEYSGEQRLGDDPPGHIPGAVNIPWTEFLGSGTDLFVNPDEVRSLLEAGTVSDTEPVIAYCRSGWRAATAVVAMDRAGMAARLYDGSWLDWSRGLTPD